LRHQVLPGLGIENEYPDAGGPEKSVDFSIFLRIWESSWRKRLVKITESYPFPAVPLAATQSGNAKVI
jgi:hypothetical protein